MEEKNIMNEEIMDVAGDTCTGGSGIGGKLVGGAIVAGLIYGGYKLVKKFKAKKGDDKYVSVNGTSEDEDDVIDAEVVEELNKKLN